MASLIWAVFILGIMQWENVRDVSTKNCDVVLVALFIRRAARYKRQNIGILGTVAGFVDDEHIGIGKPL